MAYFERTGIKDTTGEQINPAKDESLTLLRAIFKLLKPLGFITGSGSNRLSVDINSGTITTVSNVTTLPTVANVTTVATVSTVTNVPTIGGVNTFDLMKAMSRTAYNSGIRSNIT